MPSPDGPVPRNLGRGGIPGPFGTKTIYKSNRRQNVRDCDEKALLKSCLPMNRLRGFLFLTAAAGFFGAVLLFHDLLTLPALLAGTVPAVLLVSAGSILLERLCALGLGRVSRLGGKSSKRLESACP